MENHFLLVLEAQALLQKYPGVDPVVFDSGKRRLQASRSSIEAVASQTLLPQGVMRVKVLSGNEPNYLLIGGGLLALALFMKSRR
jgi:hypothetical protein